MTHARIAPGCRRLTVAHVQVQALAERFEGLPAGVSKGQALAAFKQAARPLGISPRLRDAIDVLFAFSAPQDWQPGGRPIVWPSNRLGKRQDAGAGEVDRALRNSHNRTRGVVIRAGGTRAPVCQSALNIDPRLECAPSSGQIEGGELTGYAGPSPG